ncbi:hypothetical protein IEU95_01985 [Hoyosella rhizosphaerae]|uniref:DUF4386 family protein n=1 Tax=Hoyosella rhizosphaerae TaxID=1755582 RepID=A0A916UEK7_9ACTN|nr:hypothetical protein [Hoyosella rhizosphaerae]MBN4925583.1 hypothetical protein [Hoyosella rhizosphaerae]GGC69526.1 hypothetical protein GCM10011410_22910 [Hoyosella rhizosphaerae]
MHTTQRFTALAGALAVGLLATGMVLYVLADADLETAVHSGDMASYLAAAANNTTLAVNLVLWIFAALLLAAAAIGAAVMNSSIWGYAGAAAATVGAAVAIPTYIVMLAIINVTAPAGDTTTAQTLGWVASRGDWTASVLLLAAAPLLFSLSRSQFPRWLSVLGFAAGVSGAVSVAALFIPVLSTAGYVVLLLGPAWYVGLSVTCFSVTRFSGTRLSGGVAQSASATPHERFHE